MEQKKLCFVGGHFAGNAVMSVRDAFMFGRFSFSFMALLWRQSFLNKILKDFVILLNMYMLLFMFAVKHAFLIKVLMADAFS